MYGIKFTQSQQIKQEAQLHAAHCKGYANMPTAGRSHTTYLTDWQASKGLAVVFARLHTASGANALTWCLPLCRHLQAPARAKVIDASGMYVMPGGIDPHTHLSMPFMGQVACDDFYRCGVTLVGSWESKCHV
jgi:hypothetical protein